MEDKTALSVPRLHPIAFQSVVISLGMFCRDFRCRTWLNQHSLFHKKLEWKPTFLLKSLHLQHAPNSLTSNIDSKVSASRGPRRPLVIESLDIRGAEPESKTISSNFRTYRIPDLFGFFLGVLCGLFPEADDMNTISPVPHSSNDWSVLEALSPLLSASRTSFSINEFDSVCNISTT